MALRLEDMPAGEIAKLIGNGLRDRIETEIRMVLTAHMESLIREAAKKAAEQVHANIAMYRNDREHGLILSLDLRINGEEIDLPGVPSARG